MTSDRRRRILSLTLVFAAALLVLGWRVDAIGIAAAYSDPIAQIRAQDEAPYVDSAIRMARTGDWMTPNIMGRPFLQKPPLLFWLAGLSIRLLGLSLLAVRLPSLILGAMGVTAVFAWCSATRGTGAAVLASGLLALSPFWQIFSKLCYTDVPSSACALLAITAMALDPRLERRATPLLFGSLGALSILAKSVAGVLPFAALALYWILLPADRRPRFTRLVMVAVTAVVVLAPWFIYQSVVHPRWFWADYVEVQLLGVGLQTAGSVFARPTSFYALRLAQMDPVLGLLAIVAIPGAVRRLWSRQDSGVLLLCCWILVICGALAAFQAKNLPYMAFVVPPLCLLAALCGPQQLWKDARFVGLLIAALFAIRATVHTVVPPVVGATAMRAYYELVRDAELLSCDPEDEFYSATLPLRRVRYCFVDPTGAIGRSVPFYVPLGIVITADQFLNLPALLPQFQQRLQAWNVDSIEPVATSITLQSPDQIAAMIHARPDLDFAVPSDWGKYSDAAHELRKLPGNRVFLLSRSAGKRKAQALPNRW